MSNGPNSQYKPEFTPLLNKVMKTMDDRDMLKMGIDLKYLIKARKLKLNRHGPDERAAHWQHYGKGL